MYIYKFKYCSCFHEVNFLSLPLIYLFEKLNSCVFRSLMPFLFFSLSQEKYFEEYVNERSFREN